MAAAFVHASATQTAQGNIRPKASQRPGQIASVQIAAWLARTYKDVHARFHLLLIPGRFGPGLLVTGSSGQVFHLRDGEPQIKMAVAPGRPFRQVGATGFEPATSRTPFWRSNPS